MKRTVSILFFIHVIGNSSLSFAAETNKRLKDEAIRSILDAATESNAPVNEEKAGKKKKGIKSMFSRMMSMSPKRHRPEVRANFHEKSQENSFKNIVIDNSLANKLRENAVTYYDLMNYAGRAGIAIEILPQDLYMRNTLEQVSRSYSVPQVRLEETHSYRYPDHPLMHKTSENIVGNVKILPSAPKAFSGEPYKPEKGCQNSSDIAGLIMKDLDKCLRDIKNIAVEIEEREKKNLKNEKQENVNVLATRSPPFESILDDHALMQDLFSYAKALKKPIELHELENTVRVGESIIRAFTKGEKMPEVSEDQAFVSIMWYLTALNGKKILLNPETWEVERGFVEGGTFTFPDASGAIFAYLSQFHSKRRPSSHYSAETARKSNKFRGIPLRDQLEQRGFTLNKNYSGPPLPGKEGTRTILFGTLKDGRSFMKAETAPFDPLNVKEIRATYEHSINWIKHAKKEKSGAARFENHSHRESTHQVIKDAFTQYLKEEGVESPKKKKRYQTTALTPQEGTTLGVDAMIEILEAREPLGVKGKNLLRMLKNYRKVFCLGDQSDTLTRLKGCEALVTFP